MNPTILGIRHHGTGSTRRVLERLHELRPDLVLVEGPPEFDTILKWAKPAEMCPPVAILGYNIDQPKQASFYPFADYSPEWQAMLYANTHNVPVQMIDLPLQLTMEIAASLEASQPRNLDKDPLLHLAEIEGFSNSEIWWEHRFESNRSDIDAATYFEAVMTTMQALRQAEIPSSLDIENKYREAWMRQIIRAAQKKMYANIVVVCGAWHAPMLLDIATTQAVDNDILKQLPKSKINIGATWVPWTNERLGIQSGYGAGVRTPGWSEHRWKYPKDTGAEWLSSVAQAFRSKKMDISTAHVMEALRLSETLAAMRNLSAPTLEEYNEATATVMCMGDKIQLDWIHKQLVIGHKIGKVPEKLPQLPIQADFEQHIKRLRLKRSESPRAMELDLREQNELDKSIFLHRLSALQIKWGEVSEPDGAKGTFREIWELTWRPEMEVEIITRGTWGNTIEEAATNWLMQRANSATTIHGLTQLIEHALPGALYTVNEHILHRLGDLAALSSDVFDLMSAVAPFARAMRYGNVRNTDKVALETLLEGMVRRIFVGFPNVGYGLDDDSATQLFGLMTKMQDALEVVERPEWLEGWYDALLKTQQNCHPLVLGYKTRLLLNAKRQSVPETAQQFGLALSSGNPAAYSAAWLEGFLKGSGSILLYDHVLWNILYQWTDQLPEDSFNELLPILRRTFSVYEPSERRRIGEKAKNGLELKIPATTNTEEVSNGFDIESAVRAMDMVLALIK
jgi:hypothetical protein